MHSLIKTLLLFITILGINACSSSRISLIQIDTVDLDATIELTEISHSSLAEIKFILDEVCQQYDLKINQQPSKNEIQYSRYWGSANKQHPNSIYLALKHNHDKQNILEISIFEWESIQHTEFGQTFIAQLLKELKTYVPEQGITIESL